MTNEEAREWVESRHDQNDLDMDDLAEAYRAIFGRSPTVDEDAFTQWSDLCAALESE